MQLPNRPKIPAWIQTIQMLSNPTGYLETTAKEYGDFFTIEFVGSSPLVVISNPLAIQEIFNADRNQFRTGEAAQIMLPVLGKNSMSLNDGEYHLNQRKLLKPAFHGEHMRAYSKLICDTTIAVMSEWVIGNSKPIISLIEEISLQVIMQTIFSTKNSPRIQLLKEIVSQMMNIFRSPLANSMLFFPFLQKDLGSWSLWGHFLKLRRQIDELIYAEIKERRSINYKKAYLQSTDKDILSLLMSACDEDGQPMTDRELRDELMTLIFSSHESTSITITWSLYWIHYLPKVRDRLLLELQSLNSKLDPMEVIQLPYLRAICSEVLRMNPTTLFTAPRILQSSTQIMGYKLDKGTKLLPCIYLTHHRPDLYSEPKRFQPERFLDHQYSPYEYFPFGGGNRGCIGMTFAQMVVKLVVATILLHFQLLLVNTRPEKYVFRGLLLGPSTGVKMIKV
ncbi:MAG: cytochrome P450 [Cyanobacteria bacterium P01_A01_bin.84]